MKITKWVVGLAITIVFVGLNAGSALAEIESTWVTGVTDLHVKEYVMLKDPGGYIGTNCASKYAYIPQDHPGQKNMLALILTAKAMNKEIACRIDRNTSDDHCEVFYCKID